MEPCLGPIIKILLSKESSAWSHSLQHSKSSNNATLPFAVSPSYQNRVFVTVNVTAIRALPKAGRACKKIRLLAGLSMREWKNSKAEKPHFTQCFFLSSPSLTPDLKPKRNQPHPTRTDTTTTVSLVGLSNLNWTELKLIKLLVPSATPPWLDVPST
jgi:hypothetical protein